MPAASTVRSRLSRCGPCSAYRASARAYGCSPTAQTEALARLGIKLARANDEPDEPDDDGQPDDRRLKVADDGPVTPLDHPAE